MRMSIDTAVQRCEVRKVANANRGQTSCQHTAIVVGSTLVSVICIRVRVVTQNGVLRQLSSSGLCVIFGRRPAIRVRCCQWGEVFVFAFILAAILSSTCALFS
jgi:hypothetical protein